MKQTDSFKELGTFIEDKTGKRQVWAPQYRDTLNGYIEKYGVGVLIGLLIDRDFNNVEYAIKAFEMLDEHEQTLYIQTVSREKYWASFKALEELDRLAERQVERGYDRDAELRRIRGEYGPRSPQAVEYANKWGLELSK